jgi:translation initiation factor IF-3
LNKNNKITDNSESAKTGIGVAKPAQPSTGQPWQRRQPNREQQDAHRINERIRVPKVRLVGDNVEVGVYTVEEARKFAEQQELDLVEISPNADPPVCKIIDYKKFLYEQKKKQKELKSKQQNVVVKEIRFGPNTDDHDFEFKLKHAIKFLEEGSKLKVFVFFKGRSIVYKDRGEILLLKFAQALEDYAIVEHMPELQGKKMNIFFAPKKKK